MKMTTPLHLLYLPAAILGFLTLVLPRLDVIFYVVAVISFVLGLIVALTALEQRRLLLALLGGVALPVAAVYQALLHINHHQDLTLVLWFSGSLCVQTFTAARFLNAPMTPLSMILPFFNAVGITAAFRSPAGITWTQLAIIATVVPSAALLAAIAFPQPKAKAEDPDDTL